MRGTETATAAVRKPNAATGDTAGERIPAMALAARLAPARIAAGRPNAEHGSKIATQNRNADTLTRKRHVVQVLVCRA
jgi:hypothetical protein